MENESLKLAFHLKLPGYHLRQTFAIIQAVSGTLIDMNVDEKGIHISFHDSKKETGHILEIDALRVQRFHLSPEAQKTTLKFSFDPNEFHRAIKPLSKNDSLEIFYFEGQGFLGVRPGDDRGVAYIPLDKSSDLNQYTCSLASRKPNLVMEAKAFSSICTTCNNVKGTLLEIIGYPSSAVFRAVDATKVVKYEMRTETCSAAITEVSPPATNDLFEYVKQIRSSYLNQSSSSRDPASGEIVKVTIPSLVFKPLSKFGSISTSSQIYLYFDQKNVIIRSDIGNYGSYLIKVMAEDCSTEKYPERKV